MASTYGHYFYGRIKRGVNDKRGLVKRGRNDVTAVTAAAGVLTGDDFAPSDVGSRFPVAAVPYAFG